MAKAGDNEPLDVLDEDGKPTGQVKARTEVHAAGDWHAAIHIWIARPEGHVLLQRRGRDKEIEPLRLDVSVGGHVRAGETVLNATREAEEELGLVLRPGQLEFLGTFRSQRSYVELEPPLFDNEFRDVYVVTDSRPLDQYVLDPLEVDTVYEVPLERVIALFAYGDHVPAGGYDAMRRPSDALLYSGDLPSRGRESLLEGLHAVEEWLEGQPPTA